jgi:hypothetical protein
VFPAIKSCGFARFIRIKMLPGISVVGPGGQHYLTGAVMRSNFINFITDGSFFYFRLAVNVPSPNSVESLPFIESLFSIVPVYFSTSGVP